MSRVTIELTQQDRKLLEKLALCEYRTLGQQAAFLLSQTLKVVEEHRVTQPETAALPERPEEASL